MEAQQHFPTLIQSILKITREAGSLPSLGRFSNLPLNLAFQSGVRPQTGDTKVARTGRQECLPYRAARNWVMVAIKVLLLIVTLNRD